MFSLCSSLWKENRPRQFIMLAMVRNIRYLLQRSGTCQKHSRHGSVGTELRAPDGPSGRPEGTRDPAGDPVCTAGHCRPAHCGAVRASRHYPEQYGLLRRNRIFRTGIFFRLRGLYLLAGSIQNAARSGQPDVMERNAASVMTEVWTALSSVQNGFRSSRTLFTKS